MAITRKIGERFDYKGITLEVTKCKTWYSCQGCAFQDRCHPSQKCYENDAALLAEIGECSGAVRTDKTYIYYAKVGSHETS